MASRRASTRSIPGKTSADLLLAARARNLCARSATGSQLSLRSLCPELGVPGGQVIRGLVSATLLS